MIRIPTVLGLGLLVAGLVAAVILVGKVQQISPKAAGSSPTPEDTTVSNLSDRSFTVSWTTQSAVVGFLEVGNSGQTLSRRVLDDRDKTSSSQGSYSTHYVTVDSLQPDSAYSFQIGEGINSLFDQNGVSFSVKTGKMLLANPASDLAQGTVVTNTGEPARGAIVYAQLPGAQLLSSLVSLQGNWILPLSTARTSDLTDWASYDRKTTVYALRVEGGIDGRSDVTLTTDQDQPVSPITLGQSYDFRQTTTSQSKSNSASTPNSLFEFSSLGPVTAVQTNVTLENPSKNGEVVATDKPEFFGKGPAGTQVKVIVKSSQTISGTVQVSTDGSWSFPVPSSLSPGKHDISIKWTDAKGILQTVTRSFVVNAAERPAFTSTPSATPTVNKTVLPSPTTRPRSTIPTGTPPRSGSLTPSVLLFIIGSLCTVVGAVLVRRGFLYGR